MHILNPQKKFDKNIHHQTRTLKSEEKMNELYKNRQPMEILKGGGVLIVQQWMWYGLTMRTSIVVVPSCYKYGL
jgi:hypothetical protein